MLSAEKYMELKILMLAWYINVHTGIHKHTHIYVYIYTHIWNRKGSTWKEMGTNKRWMVEQEKVMGVNMSKVHNTMWRCHNGIYYSVYSFANKSLPASSLPLGATWPCSSFFLPVWWPLLGVLLPAVLRWSFVPILYLSVIHPQGAHGKSVLKNLGTYKPDRSRVSLSPWRPCMVPSGHPAALFHVYSFCSPKSMRVKTWLHLGQLSTLPSARG